ncbi:MAG: methyltransferase domain-containing protein [Parvularculaceae bacterium]|nr:methyltransferase domain-containing protein [Parvularculaceae bacterium]
MRAWNFYRAAVALAGAFSVVACGRGEPATVIAEPLSPPPYGVEDGSPEVFVESMEVGSRELYAAREAVLAAAKIAPSERVADIGAGTGLYSLMFANAVGANGVVYAIDIEPRFLKLINQRAADLDFRNVVSVLGREIDITLPPNSADVAFIADTYHYFSDRSAIMKSVREALVSGGRLIVVDFELTAKNAGDASHDHVRFGKAGLINDVQSFGFTLIEEPVVDGLTDFYMVIFAKSDSGPAPTRETPTP